MAASIRIQAAASFRLDEIYRYGRQRWGKAQADRYLNDLFASFDKIALHGVNSRPIDADLGVSGYYYRYQHHFVYWRQLANGDIGIVTILHERMHQLERFRADLSASD